MFKILILLSMLTLIGCAGPTSPFGSQVLFSTKYVPAIERAPASTKSNVEITSFPQTQMLHAPFDLALTIEDEAGVKKDFRYEVIYNGKKVYKSWNTIDVEYLGKKKAIISFKDLNLIAGHKNDIVFLYYPHKHSRPIEYKFNEPRCDINQQNKLMNLAMFEKRFKSKDMLSNISKSYKINPAMFAALIAQESSFNLKAVSWAKAIGLTQVTPLANLDIMKIKKDWKYHKGVDDMSYVRLKRLIGQGVLNGKNDWRLNKRYSLEGGALYLDHLRNYWTRKSNFEYIKKHTNKVALTDIILASYNSGPSRVRNQIRKHNERWLWSKELKEARKYVYNIKSYCHTFKQ